MKKSEIFGKSSKILENSQNFNISDFQKSKKYFQKSFFDIFCFPKINNTQDSIPLLGVRKR